MAIVQASFKDLSPQGVAFRQIAFFPERLEIHLIRRARETAAVVAAYEATIR
jgi:hypothetical protein